MTVEDIIKAVRLSIDEESSNDASFSAAQAGDDTLMDHIIESKIGDALCWICLYCPPEILSGSDEDKSTGVITENADVVAIKGRITLPENFVRLLRVRGSDWHRAITTPIHEDSEEYMQLYDDIARATNERPQAVLIEKSQKELEVWPSDGTFEYTCITTPATSSGNTIPIPPMAKSSFIYYLTYLLLSAYGDTRAEQMLAIAKSFASQRQ